MRTVAWVRAHAADLLDALIVAVLAGTSQYEVWVGPLFQDVAGPRLANAALLALMCVPLLWRRSHPTLVFAVVLLALAVQSEVEVRAGVIARSDQGTLQGWVVALIAFYSVAAHATAAAGDDRARGHDPGLVHPRRRLGPRVRAAQLPALVEQMCDAGLPVDLVVQGEPRPVAPGVDLSAYRIVQEALTNALKHAGPARARVVVRFGAHEMELEVSDDGRGASGGDGGHGLVGMHERVALYGGELESGSANGRGFTVRAKLPA